MDYGLLLCYSRWDCLSFSLVKRVDIFDRLELELFGVDVLRGHVSLMKLIV